MNIMIYGLRGETYESVGGLQLSNTRLANFLVSRGHSVVLMSVGEARREHFFYPISPEVKLESLPMPAGMGAFEEYRLRLLELVAKHEVDVVAVLQSGRLMAYVGMAMQAADVPLLSTERGEPEFVTAAWGNAFFRAQGFSLSDRIHMLFDAYASSLPEFLQERCRVIPSPIPSHDHAFAEPHKDGEDGELRILYVGRISFEKDLFTLVRAFAKLRSDGQRCRLQIVGDGPVLGDVVKEAKSLGVEEWIEFAGHKGAEDLVSYYQQAHLFVLPSLAEGCPLSLREAMSFGVPVLASSDSRGCHEILKAGAGQLVARAPEETKMRMQILSQEAAADLMPESRAMRFYHEIKKLLNSKKSRKSFGQKALDDVRKYDADLIHNRWEELLTETSSLKGRRPTHQGAGNVRPNEMPLIDTKSVEERPKVSAVVPVYNTELYLRECLDSLISQTLPELEIILVNDASTDTSEDIINEYISRDSRIRYVKHSKNKGLLLTRQSGAAVARGEYIAHCDSDDFVDQNMYLNMYQEAKRQNADIVQCYMKRLTDGVTSEYGTNLPYFDILEGEDIFAEYIKLNIQLSLCNKIFKKELWDKASKFFALKNLRAEDTAQNMHLMFHAQRFVCLKEAYYYYRYVTNSDTQAKDEDAIVHRAYSVAFNIASFRTLMETNAVFDKYHEDYLIMVKRWYGNYVNGFLKLVAGQRFDHRRAEDWDKQLSEIVALNGEELIRQYCPHFMSAQRTLKKVMSDEQGKQQTDMTLKRTEIRADGSRPHMKILCFIPGLAQGKGGAERVVVEMSKEMVARGHTMVLVGFSRDKEAKPSYSIPEGVSAILMENDADAIRDLVKDTAPDVIFAVTSQGVIRYWNSVFDGINIPLVVQEVSSPSRIVRLWSEKINYEPAQASVLRSAFMAIPTKIRLTMHSYRGSLPAFMSKDVYTFPNAVQPARQKANVIGKGRLNKKIVSIGGLKSNKNIFPLLEAFNELKDEFPVWNIVICGEGAMRGPVQEFIDRNDLRKRVTLLGDVEDMYELYEKCQLHVISSLEEGNPLAVCESMIHAIPSIGYEDCTGTNEHIKHGTNGLLASAKDRVGGLKACMRELMGDDEKRKRFGESAYEDSHAFSPQLIYDHWETMFLSAYEYVGNAQQKISEREQACLELMALYADTRQVLSKTKHDLFMSKIISAEKMASQKYDNPLSAFLAGNTGDDKLMVYEPPYMNGEDVSFVSGAHNGLKPDVAEVNGGNGGQAVVPNFPPIEACGYSGIKGGWLAGAGKGLLRRVTWLRDRKAIRSAGIFDSEYYLRIYRDISDAGTDPVKHYYFYGADEGRNPCDDFNTSLYKYKYPDFIKTGMNPLLHYIKYGRCEGRIPK